MAETIIAENRMLIDGKLVGSVSGRQYPDIDPATEQVLGYAADGTVEDGDTAIAAARHAFDETDWSTNHAFRRHCLEQLSKAVVGHREEGAARARWQVREHPARRW